MIEYFKNLMKLFKSTKKENLDTIIDNLENVKTNINSIFDEVVNNNDFSQYRLDLLTRKICLLQGMQVNAENEYASYAKSLKSLNENKVSVYMLLFLLWAISNILFLPAISLGIIGLELYVLYYTHTLNKNLVSLHTAIKMLIQEINNTSISCNNFICKRVVEHTKALLDEKNCTVEILANELISHYIDNGIICKTSNQVIDYAIKILQYELQTNETDIKVLLEDAKEKISEEALDAELLRSRNKDNK